ncbi:hypothetical protein LFM09_35255 [Lentzea alba]|uniref:hypothetical protein n=1 Tax=Lentzea alba TaxID=2714351 RepID=UPI0039BFD656
MKITEENKLKGSLFIEAYGSLIDGIGKDAESETEKALDITFNAIGAASATVMLAIDPLGSIIGAGVGWLIEHVSFLRDALNQLMGNPEEIQANVEATKARAAELRVLAEDHKNGLATFDGWTGASSEAFKKSMDGMSQELDELAQAVETKAKIVAIMGMLVTVLRDIVRDLIAQLIGSLIGGALLAAAAMIPTFGASIPAFIGFAVGKAVALGVNIASRVARVVAALGRQMKRIGDLDDIMAKISKGWERFENSADVAEITYEGYKAQKDVDKKIDEAVAKNQPGGAGGGGTGGAPTALANARVGTVQQDGVEPLQPMQALRRVDAAEPLQPMHAVSRVDAVEPSQPMQALRRVDAAEPLQPMHAVSRMDAVEPSQPMQALKRVDAAEPLQPMHAVSRVDAVEPSQPMQALKRMDAVEPLQPMQATARMDAVEPLQPTRMNVAASDSTVASGLAMTSGTPTHEALQPMQAYTPFETATPAEEGYNPLMAPDGFSQAGGAPVQPLRPTVAYERPTRPAE